MPLLAQLGHPQLTMAAFMVPLTLLLLVRYLETLRMGYGIWLGVVFGALTTSASYYGLMMAVAVAVVVVGYLVWFRPRQLWSVLRGLVVAGAIGAVMVVPVALQYMELQEDPYFRRGFDPSVAAHFSDFLSPDDGSYLLKEIPPFEEYTFDRSGENRLFPGIVGLGFGVVGVVVLVRTVRGRVGVPGDSDDPDADDAPAAHDPAGPIDDRWRARVSLLVVAAGVVGFVFAFGDVMNVQGQNVWLPFKVARKVIPGFSGLRVTSRFFLVGECALALSAAFGVRALLHRLSVRAGAVVLAVLCAVVIAETTRQVPLVRVPASDVEQAVGRYLARQPDGVVVELPIRGTVDGVAWPYTESPRLYLSLLDDNERVNGYSGYTPPGFDALVPVYNSFPSPESLEALAAADVRYVVLRTKVIGDQFPVIMDLLRQDGVGRFTPETARARIAEIPPEQVEKVTKVPGAYVVELRPAR